MAEQRDWRENWGKGVGVGGMARSRGRKEGAARATPVKTKGSPLVGALGEIGQRTSPSSPVIPRFCVDYERQNKPEERAGS